MAYDVSSTNVVAMATNTDANAVITPEDADEATEDVHEVALPCGSNRHHGGGDGGGRDDDAKTYTVTVTRAATSHATLKSLSLEGITLHQDFASGTTSYTANAGRHVDSTTVTATATDPGAGPVVIAPLPRR